MKIGFTGTRNGMTPQQGSSFNRVISELPSFTEFHHGDCVGADDEAADAVAEMLAFAEDGETWKIICHPPVDGKLRASNKYSDKLLPEKTHFARNRDIVDATELLIGCPGCNTWQKTGGTFYTMDYAIKQGKPVKVIWPDGRVEDKGGKK